MKKLLIAIIVLIIIGGAVWFWPKPVESPVKDYVVKTEPTKPAEVFMFDPKNLDYSIEGKIKSLKNGTFIEKNPEFPISAETTMLGKSFANYDLDRDGDKDVVAIVNFNSGGTGTFAYLAVVLNNKQVAMPISAQSLGDRIKLESFSVNTANEIVLKYFVHGENQAMAEVPEKEVNQKFTVVGNKLVLIK